MATFTRLFIVCCLLVSGSLIQTAYAGYMEVTMLGTGTPRPSIDRFGPATVIKAKGRYFLFDSGRGVTIRLAQSGIDLSEIEHIFLTHLHSDHATGLSDLWLTSWIWQRQQRIKLIGPSGTEAMAEHLHEAYQPDFIYRTRNTGLTPDAFNIDSQDIAGEGIVYQQDGITITAFLVDHHPVEPAYGYRIDYDDTSIVISGDTTYSENLIKHAQDADLLIHEIAAASPTLLDRNPRLGKVLSYHTTPEQAASILNAVKPKAAVFHHVLLFGITEDTVITNIKQNYQGEGEVRMGVDLMRIGVGEQVHFY